MPIYEYECLKCGHQLEVMQKMSDDPLKQCPKCKAKKLEKLISQSAFAFKGSGWYVTDYSKSGAKKETTESKTEKAESKSVKAESKAESNTDKAESKTDKAESKTEKTESKVADKPASKTEKAATGKT
jgi:putative FmdB family regulatory protein